VAFCPKTRKLIVHVKEPRLAVNCKPDGAGMMAIDFGTLEVRGICATADTSADSDGEYAEFDFVSRYFAPWVGIPEDPVTGSLHTVLAPFWAQHGEKRGSVDTLVGLQASPRGGIVYCTLPADLPDRVFLEGSAVTVMRGEFV
jgi:predicted PhzF superfamily epimerase YddE/YHI9